MDSIFLTYFPSYNDIHFFKDPGQVPFRFKKVFGYKSYVITTSKENKLKETKKYLDLIIIPKKRIKLYKTLILFFLKNRKRIKIINIFHMEFHNILIAWLCRMFVPGVFIYLKMDNCDYTGPYPWEDIFAKKIKPSNHFQSSNQGGLKNKFKNLILKKYLIKVVDLFSVEDDDSRINYENSYPFFKDKIVTAYNGHTFDLMDIEVKKASKKNTILNVSNIGTYSKATDILLEAFAKIASNNDWELHFAGNVEKGFKPCINEFFEKFPQLKDRIIFYGHLNKKELFRLYQQAKIFCLPSRFETFANVFPEAMYFKNAIITTHYVSPKKIIDGNCGIIIEKDDINGLAEALEKLIYNPVLIEKYGEWAHNFAKQNLHWDIIVKKLYLEMKKNGLTIEKNYC